MVRHRRSSGDPYQSLMSRLWEMLHEEKDGFIETAALYCESPIEQLFFVALCFACERGQTEIDGCLYVEDQETLKRLQDMSRCRTHLIVEFQPQLGDWRPDFLIHYFDFGYPNREQKWEKLIVECDGHDFHERTKEQARRDRKRDRTAQHRGIPVLRFTGSELWSDAWECALEVISWAEKGY